MVFFKDDTTLHKFNDINVEFGYDTNYEYEKMHHINGVSLMGDGDPLQNMLEEVLHENVDFECNKEISLFTNEFIDRLNKEMFPKIAVIGGGIFGCTTAWKMAKDGYDVTLYEKNDDIISQASYVNQYRLHRGYHYPRSKETATSSQWGEHSFLQEYGNAIVNGDIEHYYAIAKEDSLVSSEEYKEFLDDLSLEYKKKILDIVNKNSIDIVVKVNELLFDPNKLRQLKEGGRVKSNRKTTRRMQEGGNIQSNTKWVYYGGTTPYKGKVVQMGNRFYTSKSGYIEGRRRRVEPKR